jgi:chaperonin GroEL (HSP60 family)
MHHAVGAGADAWRVRGPQVRDKIHPTSIISGFRLAMRESCKYITDHLAVKTDKLGKVRKLRLQAPH